MNVVKEDHKILRHLSINLFTGATRSTNSNGKGNTDVQKADEEDDYEDNRINGSNTNKSSDNIYTSNCNKSLNKVKKSSISESNKNGLGPTSMNGDAIKTVHL